MKNSQLFSLKMCHFFLFAKNLFGPELFCDQDYLFQQKFYLTKKVTTRLSKVGTGLLSSGQLSPQSELALWLEELY